MATVLGSLLLKITGDTAEAKKAIGDVEKRAKGFSTFIKGAAGIGGAIIAFKALCAVGKDLMQAWSKQEMAETRLAAAIRATGGDVDTLMSQYKAFASEIQRTTTIGDEQVLGLIQQARSFDIASDKIEEATRGAIGLSKAFGMDMNMALRAIALAYQGNYTQLSRYIPALRTAATEAEKQTVLQKAMADGFAIAQAETKTATGSMMQLQNAIGDLKEVGGKALADFLKPGINLLTDFVTKTTDSINESLRLKKIAEEIAVGKKVAAKDELALVQQQIAQRKQIIGYYGEAALAAAEASDKELKALKERLVALTEAARWEAIGQSEKKKGDIAAAAAAEKEAQRQRDLAEWIKMVNTEYDKTEQGQRAILEAEIAKWEYELSRSKNYQPQIQAILEMLYKQRDVNHEIIEAQLAEGQQLLAEMEANAIARATAEEEAQARARWSAEETARVMKEIEDHKLELAQERIEQMRRLEQSLLDFTVQIWGALDSLGSARAARELALLDKRQKATLESFTGTEEEKQALLKEFEEERAKMEYKAAMLSWQFELWGGRAAFARSILEAAKNSWPIPAIPMMALATIMGGIQMAAIRASKPIPAFAEGADFIVPPGYPDDSYLFRAESGERVTVTPSSAINNQINFPQRMIVQIGSREFNAYIQEEIDNRRILLNPKAMKR